MKMDIGIKHSQIDSCCLQSLRSKLLSDNQSPSLRNSVNKIELLCSAITQFWLQASAELQISPSDIMTSSQKIINKLPNKQLKEIKEHKVEQEEVVV